MLAAMVKNNRGELLPYTCQGTQAQCEEEAMVRWSADTWYKLKKLGASVVAVNVTEIVQQHPLVIFNHLIWAVPNEDGSCSAFVYVDFKETDTLRHMFADSTFKASVCTVNDRPTHYGFLCTEQRYRDFCDEHGLTPV